MRSPMPLAVAPPTLLRAAYERVIVQIQDGRHVVVWPGERAQAPIRGRSAP